MLKKYLLGIDNGGTISKAALFDLEGNQILKKSIKIPLLTPREGFTERTIEDIKKANYSIIKEIVDECDGEIVSIGLTGHGKGLYILGENGETIYNGIGSTDTRALEYEMMWKNDGTADLIYEKNAQKIMACQPVAILRWLKDNERTVYDKIRFVISCKDLIRYFLCGEIFTEYTDVSGTNLLNLKTRKYDLDILKLFGIEEIFTCLPEIKMSSDICGYVTEECSKATGLKIGTPVCGGMFDIDASAVAMGTINQGDMCVIAGTWSINEYISGKIVDDKTVSMNSVFCKPEYYLCEESSACSAGNLEWFRTILKDATYDELDKMVESVDPVTNNIFYLPFLFASNENPYAKGSLIGLSASHNMSNIIRAIYEGVAFAHKKHVDALLISRGTPEIIRLAGGVVNSKIWTQIFADVLGVQIMTISDAELGAKGAAMAAGIGAGIYVDYNDAIEKAVSVGNIVHPNEKMTEIYKNKYDKYKTIVDALDSCWKKI